MADFMGEVMAEGGGGLGGALEDEELDAFNDETFGGDGLGEQWEENQHEKLAMMTEEEMAAQKQSNDFFDFGSGGEELGGDLEDALEAPPRINGSNGGQLPVAGIEGLQLQAAPRPAPHHAPLTVQTAPPAPGALQDSAYPGHYAPLQGGQGLLPPSAFGAPPQAGLQDPAIMSVVPGNPPLQFQPPPHHFPPQPHGFPQQPPPRPAFSPPTVPGLKTMADLEAELLYGPPPAAAQHPPPAPGPLGHVNPAMHNLSYPGMRDRSAVPLHHQGGNHAKPHGQPPAQGQHRQQQQQFRHSPQMVQQQMQQQQQLMQQARNNGAPVAGKPPGPQDLAEMNRFHERQQQGEQGRGPPMEQRGPPMEQRGPPMESRGPPMELRGPPMEQRGPPMELRGPPMELRGPPMELRGPPPGDHRMQQGDHRGPPPQQMDHRGPPPDHRMQQQGGDHRRHQDHGGWGGGYDQRQEQHHYYDRRQDQGRGYDQGPRQQGRGFQQEREGAPRGYDQNRFDQRFQENRYFEQATRRDLMPGHVQTLGILKQSRSRTDREGRGGGGIEDDDCLLGDSEELSFNPTGDPALDAKLQADAEDRMRKRKYANSDDEYAGLMSQRDKQWIINIQLNQLKCDNPYVDDYYYTMYQTKKQLESSGTDRAGGQLLLNESLGDGSSGYTPTQFENSLGKLQVVTVKAPRQIIDVGVVRSAESPVTVQPAPHHDSSPAPGAVIVLDRKQESADYKQVLIQIEVLYLALLDLESDQLKLTALPTGAPLREKLASAESLHLGIIQAGLARPGWLADCLAVPKGRSLVLRCLPHLAAPRAAALCGGLLASIHLLARGEPADARFWLALSHHIKSQSLDALEGPARALLGLSKKVTCLLLGTGLGATAVLSLLLRAAGQGATQGVWAQLAGALLGCVSEGLALGPPLAPLRLQEDSLDRLLALTEPQQLAWRQVVRAASAAS